ncbi:MAG: macro domain-containing protein [Spirochaetes bacterium]|nr:macro domain-containing protein [Spirochaetota bacterium]
MIKVLIGDLFESKNQTIVNTVNCIGIMGKGIALQFKKKYPDMYKDYVERCKLSEVKLGLPYLYKTLLPPWILNFPTKQHWRSITNLKDIVNGLEYLLTHYKEWGITSIAVPPLGCGNGQLEWRIVGPTLYRYLNRMDIPVELYAPHGTPHEELQSAFLGKENGLKADQNTMPSPQFIKPEWIVLIEILYRIENEKYHWPVGRTIFQKIAYFATEQGLDTGLKYIRGSFGPYTSDLKQITSRLLKNGLIEEENQEPMIHIKTGPTFPDARKAYQDAIRRSEKIILKTVDLFLRINSQQAELVASAIFVSKELMNKLHRSPFEKEVYEEILKWKIKRRPPLEPGEVASTIRNLAGLNILNVTASSSLPVAEVI